MMRKKGRALRKEQERLGSDGAEARASAAGKGAREAPPLDFAPVPRRFRHDGWTPERQKAFIEALADTGCVTRAAAMVNMSQQNCYTLRRSAGAESFRRAWDAALDFGLKRLKDIAFERAIEGVSGQPCPTRLRIVRGTIRPEHSGPRLRRRQADGIPAQA
ncbi:MAG: hypothetical protein E6G94_04880 [Alphaproteobacteria bacterium]|nr:MAG: hypothetical protein E6G94_04880 [Alphaproteobacteria bacterium]